MPSENGKTLYLFLDESGNFDFSPKGTKFFILTSFSTFNPTFKRNKLINLRYKLLEDGVDEKFFHASEDKQATRDKVFSILSELGDTYEVNSILVRKNRTNPALYEECYSKKGKIVKRTTGAILYKKICECLLKYIFQGKKSKVEKIIVVLGSLYTGDKNKIILQTLKHSLKENFPNTPFEIYSHQACVDLNCQLADYCCWAIAAKAERGEARPYEAIKGQILSIYDYFKKGSREYYSNI